MASLAFAAKGTILQMGDAGSPEVFTKIAEIADISGGGGQTPQIDTTNFDSLAKEFILDLPDNGSYTLTGNFIPSDAGQTMLRQRFDDQALRNFKIILTDGSSTTLNLLASVQSYSVNMAQGDKVNLSVTLLVSGKITYT